MTSNLPECWQQVEDAVGAGIKRFILHGVPGTGKTFGASLIGAHNGAERLTCTEDMTDSDIFGGFKPSAQGGGSGFAWQDGAVLRAWQRGARVVIDEADKASGDVLGLLLNATDSDQSAEYWHPVRETKVRQHPSFSVAITSNIVSPDDLPEALRDRFPVAVKINAPHPDALACLPPDLRDAAAALVACEDPERRASLRAFFAFDTMRSGGLEPERAAVLAFGAQRAQAIADALAITKVAN